MNQKNVQLKTLNESQQVLPKTSFITDRSWLIDVLSLAFFIFIFYLCWIGSYPVFTPDEGRYSEIAREMIATGDYITPRLNGIVFLDKPILHYWLQSLALHFFGVKEWAIRLPPTLLGVFLGLITYLCGRLLFDRRTGLLSAIILVTSLLYFASAHYANLDLEVAVFISCTLLFIGTALESNNARLRVYFLLAAYVFAALAFLTKGLIGIVFPVLITGSWILLLGRKALLHKMLLLPGLLLFLLIVFPWYYMVQKANPAFLQYFFVTQQFTRFLSANVVFNNPSPWWFFIPIVFIGFFPWSCFLIQAIGGSLYRIWQNRKQHAGELFLLLWVVIIFTFFSIPHSKTITYILPIFAPLSLLIGRFFATHWMHSKEHSMTLSVIVFVLSSFILATLLLMMPHYQWLHIATPFSSYLIALASIFILGAICALATYRLQNASFFFMNCTLTSIIFLLVLIMGAAHLNQTTAKPLIAKLKPILTPQDEVITYFKYYQDIPLYLSRRVSIVANWDMPNIVNKDNWMRELWYGRSFQKTGDWLINESTFWQRFNGDKRVFVFINDNYLSQFKKGANHYYFLGKYNDIYLLSNQPNQFNFLVSH